MVSLVKEVAAVAAARRLAPLHRVKVALQLATCHFAARGRGLSVRGNLCSEVARGRWDSMIFFCWEVR